MKETLAFSWSRLDILRTKIAFNMKEKYFNKKVLLLKYINKNIFWKVKRPILSKKIILFMLRFLNIFSQEYRRTAFFNVSNIYLLVIPYFTLIRWWVVKFWIKFCIGYLIMTSCCLPLHQELILNYLQTDQI